MIQTIELYQQRFSFALAKIFNNAILAIDDSIYSPIQKQAWIGNHSDAFWQRRFEQTKPFVAVIEDKAVGFVNF